MMEEPLQEYLEGIGISQAIIRELQDEKITMSTISIMNDNDLKNFIPKLGDRVNIKDFCKRRLSLRKNSLIESIKMKIDKKRENENNMGEPSRSVRKITRTVEVGWLHFDGREERYKQLKTRNGGGTRKIIVDRHSKCLEILWQAKEKFFPGGISTKGPLENFEFRLLDFKNHEIDHELTVQYLFDSTGFSKLKFYMGTKNIGSETSNSSAVSVPNNPDRIFEHGECNADKLSTTDILSSQSAVSDDIHNCNLDDFEEAFENYEELNMPGLDTSHIYPISERQAPTSSDFMLPDGEFQIDTIPRLSADATIMNLYINRQNCVSEMLQAYDDLNIVEKMLNVEFLGEQGQDLGGLSKELFSVFWKEIEILFFIGEDIVVPSLPLHRKKEKEKFITIGRILAHMMLLTGTIPIKLSRCIYLAFGHSNINNRILQEDFLLFLSEIERNLINKALQNFKSLTSSELETITNIFVSYNYMTIPKENDFKQQIDDIAIEVLIERPRAFVELIKKGFPITLLNFWNNINEHGLTFILNQQRPTIDKVLNCIQTEEILTNKQIKVLHYLKMYIQELSSDSLLHFLYFITGSSIMPHEIKVAFNALSDQKRRPIIHTCSNMIELSYTYDTYKEFKKEINMYLNSDYSFQYTQI